MIILGFTQKLKARCDDEMSFEFAMGAACNRKEPSKLPITTSAIPFSDIRWN